MTQQSEVKKQVVIYLRSVPMGRGEDVSLKRTVRSSRGGQHERTV
jgi:hypothetical protein